MTTARQPSPTWRISLLIAVAAVQLGILWVTQIPLGVPGEWVWPRQDFSSESLFGLLLLLPACAGYIWFVRDGFRSIAGLSLWQRRSRLALLYALSVAWTFLTLWSLPGTQGLPRLPLTLYLHGTSGYFEQAQEIEDISEFLKTYPQRIADPSQPENYLHLGTHPPGLTLGYRVLLNACEASPVLQWLGTSTQPAEVRDVLSSLRSIHPDRLTPAASACVWLSGCLMVFVANLALLPLYGVVARTASLPQGWLAAALWPLIPSLLIFLPKSDFIYPLIALAAQLCWIWALEDRPVWSCMTGFILSLGMWLSLAMVPVGAILFLQWVLAVARSEKRLKMFSVAGWGALGFVLPVLVAMLAGVQLPLIWLRNYGNHAAFYDHNLRTFWLWLPVNVVEAGFSIGLPIVAWGLLAVRQSKSRRRHSAPLCALAIWGLLWLTGKNMGEAARLWGMLFPFAIWAAMPTPIEESDQETEVTVLLVAQTLVAIGTVLRVKGLDFGV